MSVRLQLDVCHFSQWWRCLVNRCEIEASTLSFAGKTMRSVPEHLECEPTVKVLHASTYLYLCLVRWQERSVFHYEQCSSIVSSNMTCMSYLNWQWKNIVCVCLCLSHCICLYLPVYVCVPSAVARIFGLSSWTTFFHLQFIFMRSLTWRAAPTSGRLRGTNDAKKSRRWKILIFCSYTQVV